MLLLENVFNRPFSVGYYWPLIVVTKLGNLPIWYLHLTVQSNQWSFVSDLVWRYISESHVYFEKFSPHRPCCRAFVQSGVSSWCLQSFSSVQIPWYSLSRPRTWSSCDDESSETHPSLMWSCGQGLQKLEVCFSTFTVDYAVCLAVFKKGMTLKKFLAVEKKCFTSTAVSFVLSLPQFFVFLQYFFLSHRIPNLK